MRTAFLYKLKRSPLIRPIPSAGHRIGAKKHITSASMLTPFALIQAYIISYPRIVIVPDKLLIHNLAMSGDKNQIPHSTDVQKGFWERFKPPYLMAITLLTEHCQMLSSLYNLSLILLNKW